MMMNDNNINITDDILGDEWDEDFLNSVIEAETDAISSSFKPNPTNPSSSPTSFSNHHQFQQQQQQQPPKPFVSGGFSPPRELSQRPAPTLFDTDDKDIEFERFKEHREPKRASKQIVNLEKECLKLKNDRCKKEDQPKFVSSENEEDNAHAKRSKSVENGRDFGIRAPDPPKASSTFQSGVSSNYPTGETTAKDKGVETEIVTHRVAQDLPSDDLSAHLDLSQNLLAVWGSPSNKMLRSDVVSKLFASCQKEIHYLFGYMSTSPPSEITPKPILDVISSRVPLHYLNDCFHTPKVHTPEATKVSHLYNALTKIAHETDVLETLIPPLLDLCSMENVAFVHSSLCILHTVLKLLLESEKDFKRRDSVFIDGICIGKDLLDFDGLGSVKDGKPFNEDMLSRKACNYPSALQPHVNWSNIFDIMHHISMRITEENVRLETVSIMILLFLRSSAYFEREKFSQNSVFKTISELLKKDAGLRVKEKTLRLLYLVLNCPKLLATFCRGCKEGDSSSGTDDNASVPDFENFKIILLGLADCLSFIRCGLLELKISRKAILVLSFLASSGQPGFEIFMGHRLSITLSVNYLQSILQLLLSENLFEAQADNEMPEIFKERTFLMREILILLNRLVSSPSYSAIVIRGLTEKREMANLTFEVATGLSRKGNKNEQQDSMVKQIRRTEIVDLACQFKNRVETHIPDHLG